MKSIQKFLLYSLALFMLNGCSDDTRQKQITEWVNPFIGTGGHGHTYPGPSMPFGMVQLSPDTRLTGWDGCSGYHYSDSVVFGFQPHSPKRDWNCRLLRHIADAFHRRHKNIAGYSPGYSKHLCFIFQPSK
jgi:putative alpha-1,2-mannosidase